MTAKEFIEIYESKKAKYGKETYRYISQILAEAKEQHKQDFLTSKKAQKTIEEGKTPDHEQSWRSFKGKATEKLIQKIIEDKVETLGLKIINGNSLEKKKIENLSKSLQKVRNSIIISYEKYGEHLPDGDIVVYEQKTNKVIALLSAKVTLRERIAQTGYWKLKLAENPETAHIKVFVVTLDEDGTLTNTETLKKGRAIIEKDTDGAYILTQAKIEESEKVKLFDKFLEDLKNYL